MSKEERLWQEFVETADANDFEMRFYDINRRFSIMVNKVVNEIQDNGDWQPFAKEVRR